MPELEATAPPIPFWFYRVVAGAAEPWGQLGRRRACNNTVRAFGRARAQLFPGQADGERD
jgi:hypothetical protein